MKTNTRVTFFTGAFRWLPGTLIAVVLGACGGGASNSTSMQASTGKANAARVSIGSITGFGSVHVNGVKFETTSAKITVNGQAAMQTDLKVGEVVAVQGHHDDSTGQDVAESIEFRDNVQGPVSMIDMTAGTLVVLGQNVIVSTDTSFGVTIMPASLAGLAVNDIVEVSGMPAANGDIHATRIEKKAAGAAFEVTGVAASTNLSAKTLKINALTVDFSAAALVGFPTTGPKDGDRVEANGTSLGSAGELKATHLELLTDHEFGQANDEGELEGLITRFASATDFDVTGHPVTTSASTTFEGGVITDLALNVRVEAEGTVNASGVLEATKVRIHLMSASATRLLGQADKVDTTAGTVTVLGITVSVTAMTHFEDDGSESISTFSLSDVHTGDWLDIRGSESPAGSNKVVATSIKRAEAQSSVRLAGTVKTAMQPSFTILSVNVSTTPTTLFRDASHASATASAFFMNLVGQIAAVRGTWDGTTLTAQQASLGEGEDD
jgi:hypothetical protein